MGADQRDQWKTSDSERAASCAEALDTGVAELLSNHKVQMRALLNRALGAMPEGHARELVLEARRLLDDQAVELDAAERA